MIPNGAWLGFPHDWSIEDLPDQTTGIVAGSFDKNSIGKSSTGFTVGGTAWYRKHLFQNHLFKTALSAFILMACI